MNPMGLFSRIRSTFNHRPRASLKEAEVLVDQLIELGFLKFVPDSQKTEIRRQLVESLQKRYLDSEYDDNFHCADRRNYHADNENLAEGDVGRYILEMKEVLTREGVKLESVRDEFGRDDYHVVINEISHLIHDSTGDPRQNWWAIATRRLLEIVNSLLEQAGSQERLYAIEGGNDGRVILLTSEMHNLLMENATIFNHDWLPRPAMDV